MTDPDHFIHNGRAYQEAPETDEDCNCNGCAFHDDISCERPRLLADLAFGASCGLRSVIYLEVTKQ